MKTRKNNSTIQHSILCFLKGEKGGLDVCKSIRCVPCPLITDTKRPAWDRSLRGSSPSEGSGARHRGRALLLRTGPITNCHQSNCETCHRKRALRELCVIHVCKHRGPAKAAPGPGLLGAPLRAGPHRCCQILTDV